MQQRHQTNDINKVHRRKKNIRNDLSLFFNIGHHDSLQAVNTNDLNDLVTDHSFIAPNEICGIAIGLLSVLMNRHIIDMPFSKLYQQR
jgi:hypothetical protein